MCGDFCAMKKGMQVFGGDISAAKTGACTTDPLSAAASA
jgi:hypothetical protein